MFIIIKILVTATLIVAINEIAQRYDKLGGLIAALPITTFLVIFWMYFEGASNKQISNHISFTLFFILPTLPMFLFFPLLISRFGFLITIFISILLTGILVYLFNYIYQYYGIDILN